MKQETLEDIAKWVIEFRITKNEYARVSDFEMYNTIIEKVSKWQQERGYSQLDVVRILSKYETLSNEDFNKWFEQFKNRIR